MADPAVAAAQTETGETTLSLSSLLLSLTISNFLYFSIHEIFIFHLSVSLIHSLSFHSSLSYSSLSSPPVCLIPSFVLSYLSFSIHVIFSPVSFLLGPSPLPCLLLSHLSVFVVCVRRSLLWGRYWAIALRPASAATRHLSST